jgi:hypothetical protein
VSLALHQISFNFLHQILIEWDTVQ